MSKEEDVGTAVQGTDEERGVVLRSACCIQPNLLSFPLLSFALLSFAIPLFCPSLFCYSSLLLLLSTAGNQLTVSSVLLRSLPLSDSLSLSDLFLTLFFFHSLA